jgi:hypothetical protein
MSNILPLSLRLAVSASYDKEKLELEEYNVVKSLIKDVCYAIQDGGLSEGNIWLYQSVITVIKIYLIRNPDDYSVGIRFPLFLQKIKPVFKDETWKEILEDNKDILKCYPSVPL